MDVLANGRSGEITDSRYNPATADPSAGMTVERQVSNAPRLNGVTDQGADGAAFGSAGGSASNISPNFSFITADAFAAGTT
jgi:hypothetical protein